MRLSNDDRQKLAALVDKDLCRGTIIIVEAGVSPVEVITSASGVSSYEALCTLLPALQSATKLSAPIGLNTLHAYTTHEPSATVAKALADRGITTSMLPSSICTSTQDAKGDTGADTVDARNERPGYGSYDVHAAAEQQLKRVLQEQPGWAVCDDVQKSALEMIVHKMARLLNNAPNHLDSWHDIAGYATLAEQNIKKLSSKTEL